MRKLCGIGVAISLACLWMATAPKVEAQNWDGSATPWICKNIACKDLSFGFPGIRRWYCYDSMGNYIGACECNVQDTNVYAMCTYNYNAQTTCVYTNDAVNACDGTYTPPGGGEAVCLWIMQYCRL
jgi:hypothetical protein